MLLPAITPLLALLLLLLWITLAVVDAKKVTTKATDKKSVLKFHLYVVFAIKPVHSILLAIIPVFTPIAIALVLPLFSTYLRPIEIFIK